MATRPTTMAVAAPTGVGLPEREESRDVQTRSGAAARNVAVKASAAMLFDASALPELNPNHPNQSTPAPSSVNGTLCGSSDEDGYSRRLPTAMAHATAAIAAFT